MSKTLLALAWVSENDQKGSNVPDRRRTSQALGLKTAAPQGEGFIRPAVLTINDFIENPPFSERKTVRTPLGHARRAQAYLQCRRNHFAAEECDP
jgi:hypothetical protein